MTCLLASLSGPLIFDQSVLFNFRGLSSSIMHVLLLFGACLCITFFSSLCDQFFILFTAGLALGLRLFLPISFWSELTFLLVVLIC